MAEELPHEMPEDMDSKLKLLDSIIRTGIEKLLTEARKRAFLKPPYGRPQEPNPLVTEDEFLRTCSSTDFKNANEEPAFHYLYGFNPLTFLADYLHWAHPNTFKARKIDVGRCFDRLKFRAAHAVKQLEVATSLREIASFQRSGLLWGPICSSVTVGSGLCILKIARPGTVVVELSESGDFEVIYKVFEVVVPEATFDQPTKVKLTELQPAKHYFVRACLRDSNYPKIAPPVESPASMSSRSGRSMSKFNIKPVVAEPVIETPAEEDYSYRFGGSKDGFFSYSQLWSLPIDVHNQPPAIDTKGKDGGKGTSARPAAGTETTIPDPDPAADAVNIFAVGCLYGASESQSKNSQAPELNLSWNSLCEVAGIADDARLVTCLLGDIFSNEAYSGYQSNARDYLRDYILSGSAAKTTSASDELLEKKDTSVAAAYAQLDAEMTQITSVYLSRLRHAMSKCKGLSSLNSIMRQSNVFLAWNDQRVGSEIDLRYEEYAAKKLLQDQKRYEKKYEAELKKRAQHKRAATGSSNTTAVEIPPPPTIQLPPISPSIHALLQSFPVESREDIPRVLYREISLSPAVDVFILDGRDSYIGKTQSRWLLHKLENSQATWKLVFVGFPVSVKVSKVVATDGGEVGSVNDLAGGLGSIESIGDVNFPDVTGNSTTSAVDVSEYTSAAAAAVNLNRQVTMSSPMLVADDHDEIGRSKFSLQYIIASIQSKIDSSIASSHDISGVDISHSLSQYASSASMPELPIAADARDDVSVGTNSSSGDARHDQLAEQLAPGQALLKVESGVIFVTSGVESPYVASMDTTNWNRMFCMEVGVGSPVLTQSPIVSNTLASNVQVHVDPVKDVEPTFLYGGEMMFPHLVGGKPVTGSRISTAQSSSNLSHIPTLIASCASISFNPEDETLNVKIIGSTAREYTSANGISESILDSNVVLYDTVMYVPSN